MLPRIVDCCHRNLLRGRSTGKLRLLLKYAHARSHGHKADGSRTLYAFSRDHGLPFSSFWRKVNAKYHIPLNALILAMVVQLGLCSIDFGTTTGFNTVIAVATEGYCELVL